MTARPFVHLAEPLEIRITTELFAAAFPERGASSFVLGVASAEESASAGLDRFAFLGAEPVASFRAARIPGRRVEGRPVARVVTIDDRAPRETREHEHETTQPFEALRAFLAAYAVPASVFDRAYPFPLRAGAVGYIGYECGQFLERLPCAARPSPGMPDIAFAVHRWVVATDRASRTSWLSVIGAGADLAAAQKDAEAMRDRLRAIFAAAVAAPSRGARAEERAGAARDPVSVLTNDQYVARIGVAKAHIEAGDAFEICLTNAHRAAFPRDAAWALFEELGCTNPAPFAALLDLPEGAVVSSSPERFLSLDAARRVESRPIKGTRPRGADAAEDLALAHELATSEKDRAENAMIVDLTRNDLGRVCRVGTVEVPELYAVETYATVHQLVSTVRGVLDEKRDAIELIVACFPPGSMTGAPKIEAVTILERLEPVERGVYAGALGYIDAAGALDLSVVIRTAVVRDGVAVFSTGGAIVADSDPTAELAETQHKARALVAALRAVSREVDAPPKAGGAPLRGIAEVEP